MIDTEIQQSDAYLAKQPFGQVPVMEEDGRSALFETGSILLDVATRAGELLPESPNDKALAICWLFAALNSIEPFLSNLAEVDFFIEDEEEKERRRPTVMPMVHQRLDQLSRSLGNKDYLVADAFSIADMMTSSVLKIIGHTDLLHLYPNLTAFRDRCFARSSYKEAVADQLAAFANHEPEDMKYELRKSR